MSETNYVEYSDNCELEEILEDFSSMKPPVLPIDKEFHVFIAYRSVSPDRHVAYQIDKLLRSNGYKCCVHEREFLPGETIVGNILKNIERSIKVVFLLSENSKTSEWCQYEMTATETIHIQNKGYKPIILKLDNCEVPDSMRHYTYLLGSKPPEQWINKLAKAINNETDHLITSRKNIKFVAVPCINYNRDKLHPIDSCRYPHICAKYIISDEPCDEANCQKNHNLVTDQSREILVDLGFIADGHYSTLLQTYRQKCREKMAFMPHEGVTGPCCYYNDRGCLLGDFHCPFTHICKDWFYGECLKHRCKLSHEILNPHTKHLLDIFEIDTNQPEDIILNSYREKYPHKKFLSLPADRSISKAKFCRENWLVIAGAAIAVIIATAFVVNRIQK